jgi:hypothetical protein
VVVNGRGYALTLLLPVSSWQQDLARLAPVFEFFKPTP